MARRKRLRLLALACLATACVGDRRAAHTIHLDGEVRLSLDATRGTFSLRAAAGGLLAIEDATSTLLLDSGPLRALDYPSKTVLESDIAGGKTVILVSRGPGLPTLRTRFSWEPGSSSIRVQAEAENDGRKSMATPRVLGFRPVDCQTVWGCRAEITTRPAKTAILINGYQSWSYSGVTALPTGTIEQSDDSLLQCGNNVDSRIDPNLSWWYAALQGEGGASLVAGATTTELWKTAVVFELGASQELPSAESSAVGSSTLSRFQVWTGGTGDSLSLTPGRKVASEEVYLGLHSDAIAGLDDYARAASDKAPSKPSPVAPPLGWTSWYTYFPDVTDADVRENASFIRDHGLLALGYDWIQIDDGWEVEWGDWRPNKKFASGMDGLATSLIREGHKMGIWIAPLLVEHRLPLVSEHPDWFLRNPAGDPIVYLGGGRVLRVLDPTHPGVDAWLAERFREIRSWGYELFKVDFLFAGAYEGIHSDATATSLSAYRQALTAIKRGAGEGVIFLASGAPHLPTTGIFHANRAGPDICTKQFQPSWPLLAQELRDSFVRFAGHGAWFLNDPDAVLVRPNQTLDEARTAVTAAALIGGPFLLGDRLGVLEPSRLELLSRPEIVGIVRAGRSAVPIDLFHEVNARPLGPVAAGVEDILFGGHGTTTRLPRIWSLDPGDGTRWVGVFNWRGEPMPIQVDLARLGLVPNASYTVTEYWSQRDLGRVRGSMTLDQSRNSVQLLRILP